MINDSLRMPNDERLLMMNFEIQPKKVNYRPDRSSTPVRSSF